MSRDIPDQEFSARIQSAIEAGHILPWYQPVMDTEGVHLLSVEALPRWDDPVDGVIPAGAFLDQAIRCGILPAISGELHIRSFRALADWRERGLSPRRMSFNLTGPELCSHDVIERMLWALDAASASPGEIAVEVAEDVLHGPEAATAAAALAHLTRLGVELCLDDFGAGPNDPASFGRAEFAMAKVAMRVVSRLGEDDEATAVLSRLACMARSGGASIIAKGVETRVQIDILSEIGCDGQQGYAIARPMPEDSFIEWLDLNTWPVPKMERVSAR